MKKLLIAFAAALAFAAPAAHAGGLTDGFGLYGGVSTLGLNLGVKKAVSESLDLRLGVNTFKYSADFDENNVNYDADLKMNSVELMADWKPFKGGFFLTAGVLYNDNKVDADARGMGTFEVNDVVYSGANAVGKFRGEMDKDSISPYVGMGYQFKPFGKKGLQMQVSLGVLQQDFEGKLSVSGVDDPTGTLAADVEEANRRLEDDADQLNLYPVANIGLTYQF